MSVGAGRMTFVGMVLAFVVVGATQTQTTASPAGTVDTSDVVDMENDPSRDPAVQHLVSDVGISTADGISQMERQVAAGLAERDMPTELRKIWTGRRIDHSSNGRLIVGITDAKDAEAIRQHYGSFGVSDIEMQEFEASDEELNRLADELQSRLNPNPNEAPSIEIGRRELGYVTVTIVPGQMSSAEKSVVPTARNLPSDVVKIVEAESIEPGVLENCRVNDHIWCDPPLRGSIRIWTGTGCSAGFNARSNSDNKPYVLTAGHCHQNSNPVRTRFHNLVEHDIGPFHASMAGPVGDAGIIRVNNPGSAGWDFGWPIITINPNRGSHSRNDSYVISNVLDAQLDDRVCITGGTSAQTTCGRVTDTFASIGNIDGLFEVEPACAGGGDSGSPYFSFGVAYGVHSGGPRGFTCSWNRAEHAYEAQNSMNVHILTG